MPDKAPSKSMNMSGMGITQSTLGKPGIEISSGEVQTEFLRDLRGQSGIKIYKEMAYNDAICFAMLYGIEHLIKRVTYSIERGTDDQEGEKARYLVDTALHDMDFSWPETVSEILTMLQYGYSWHEMNYKLRRGMSNNPKTNSKYDDGMVGWRSFSGRSQETLSEWDIDEKTGDIKGFIQEAPPDFNSVNIPLSKSLHFRTNTRFNNPEGQSVLRGAYKTYYYKKRVVEFEAIGIERSLVGIPVMEIPAEYCLKNAPDEKKEVYAAAQALVTRVRRDEQMGMVIPQSRDEHGNKLFELYLLKMDANQASEIAKTISRYDRDIAITLLADFILLGHERVGSFALSKNKTHLFSIALESFVQVIVDQINRVAIPKLLIANKMNVANPPKMVPGVIDSPDLTEFSNYVSKLAGIVDLGVDEPQVKNYMRGIARIPSLPSVTEDGQAQGAEPTGQPTEPQPEEPPVAPSEGDQDAGIK